MEIAVLWMAITSILITTTFGKRLPSSRRFDLDMAEAMSSRNGTRIADFINILHFKKIYDGEDRSDWMSELPAKIARKPLTEISIPGSHDSFTITLDPDGPIGPTDGLEEGFRKAINKIHQLLWLFPGQSTPASKKIIYNWSVTQSLTLSDQLKAGIRYFDLRVATKSGSEGTFLLHSLYGQSTRSALHEIHSFLESHSKEVVIIDFNHFYGMTSSDHRGLIRQISDVFGENLVPEKKGFSRLTLENIWKEGQQVILLYHESDRASEAPYVWNGGSSIESPWPNTNKMAKAMKKIKAWTKERASVAEATPSEVQPFWVTQGILTARAYDIAPMSLAEIWTGFSKGDWSSMKRELGSPMCQSVSTWLKNQRAGKGGINIAIADFVEESDFIENVLALNLKS